MIENAAQRRMASEIVDSIGELLGIDVYVYKLGPNAEGGWRIEAFRSNTREQWVVESAAALTAATEIAQLVGFPLKNE